MSNLRFQKPKRKKEGMGFYIALVGCLAAIVAVTWTAVGNLDTLTPDQESPSSRASKEPSDTQEAGGVPNQYIDGFDWGEDLTNEYSSVMNEMSSTVSSTDTSSKKTSSSEAKQTNAKPASSSATSSRRDVAKEVSSFNAGADKPKQSYMLPVGNEVLKEYSGGKLVYSMTFGDWRVHDGVDFKAAKSDVVRTVGDGTVKDIVKDPLYGTTVVIDHGDFEAHYCGLVENVIVEKGQQVMMGDDLGSLSDIPCEIVEEIHLHFGVKKDGKWVDPIEAMRKK